MNSNVDAEFNLPPKMGIEYFDNYMHIKRKWRGAATIFLAIFLVVWVWILWSTYSEYSDPEGTGNPQALMIFLSVFGLIAVGNAFYLLASFFNATDVFASKQLLEIKNGPVPWIGNKKLNSQEITQLYVKKVVKGSREKPRVSFEVRIIDPNANDTKLVSGFTIRDQAAFIEQKIEHYLGIIDDPTINNDDDDY